MREENSKEVKFFVNGLFIMYVMFLLFLNNWIFGIKIV